MTIRGSTTELREIGVGTAAVLTDVLAWRMAPTAWAAVDGLLVAIEGALVQVDPAELAAATAELQLLGPSRIVPIGRQPQTSGPPPEIRDRMNRLVHELGGPPPADRAGGDTPAAGR